MKKFPKNLRKYNEFCEFKGKFQKHEGGIAWYQYLRMKEMYNNVGIIEEKIYQ